MDIVQRLDEMKLLDVVSREDLARWADRFERVSYHRGAVVIRQGETSTDFYIVDRGELRVRARKEGKELPLAYFYEGDYFGETGLLIGAPRNATVDVLTDAELLVLGKQDFGQLMEEFPEIREHLRDLGQQREAAGLIRFLWQEPDEVTVFFSTKHWIALLYALRLTLLMGIAGLVTGAIYVGAELGAASAAMLMVVSGSLLALTVLSFVYSFLDWRNDHYIITSLRVLHVERVLLLREDRDEAPVERVQDVQVQQKGVLANLMDFGDVIIQTAAATEKIVFANVAQPQYVRDALFGPMKYQLTQARAEVRDSIRRELGERLKILVTPLEDQAESEKEPSTPAEKQAELNLLQRAGQWLQGLINFETWLLSDGGNTITWRKNGWLLLQGSLAPFFVAILVIGLIIVLLSQGIGSPGIGALLLLALLAVLGWWVYVYWDWQNDIYQISGSRLIDLKRRPLFLEEIRRETTLDNVQNISLSIPGPIAQVLNFGTVVIETAGEMGAFRFEHVHNPRGVQAEIFSRRERENQRRRDTEMHRRHSEVAEWFEIYEELKQKRTPDTFQGSEQG